MKHLSTALLLAAGIAGTTTARAQTAVTFGPRLGGNLATFSYSGADLPINETNYVTGVQVGGTANLSFGRLAFQPSVLYTQKGAELKASQRFEDNGYATSLAATMTPRLHYLEVPLNFVYTEGGDHGFQVFAGPYVAFGVGGGGSYQVTIASTDPSAAPFNGSYPGSLTVEYGDTQNDNANAGNGGTMSAPPLVFTARRFDAGLNGGVGYRLGPVQAQVGYGLGLLNFSPKDADGNDTGTKGYHRGFQLTATYFFSGK
jgi:hypothetical protein